MEWSGPAIFLTYKEFGVHHRVLEVFGPRGRVRGLVRLGKRPPAWLSYKGKLLQVRWCARLSEQLGTFYVEPLDIAPVPYGQPFSEQVGRMLILTLLRQCPENHPYPHLLSQTCATLVQCLEPSVYARWELNFLSHVGFGLDLSRCALTGHSGPLAYVSPNTGRAVTAQAGQPWAHKLLPIPPFLLAQAPVTAACIRAALHLTGHFLKMHGIISPQHTFWRMRPHLVSIL